MSIVYLTKHNERVQDFFEIEDTHDETFYYPKLAKKRKVAPKVWVSRYIDTNKKLLASKFSPTLVACNKTMGMAIEPLRDPCNFLKKNEGIKWIKKKAHVCGKTSGLPAIPKVSEMPKKTPRVEKNLITYNKELIKKTKPRQPAPRYVDTRHGDTHSLCNSGVMPAYVFSPTFGKIPSYLKRIKSMIFKYTAEINKKTSLDRIAPLENEKRMEILIGLKKKWYELNYTFQKLPVLTDTIPKQMRKFNLNEELFQLEKDILLIENSPSIFICS